ncbi:uncharacterized protein LOC143853353 [Tasmannia lanceolata]|uniref:uncharacterized protein LOC143853353 n=1 Tax=Tasmannia lanceolata TaxID=3420 RepID=UPI004062F670
MRLRNLTRQPSQSQAQDSQPQLDDSQVHYRDDQAQYLDEQPLSHVHDSQAQGQDSQPQHSSIPQSEDVASSSRRARGPTYYKDTWRHTQSQRKRVEFNEIEQFREGNRQFKEEITLRTQDFLSNFMRSQNPAKVTPSRVDAPSSSGSHPARSRPEVILMSLTQPGVEVARGLLVSEDPMMLVDGTPNGRWILSDQYQGSNCGQ